MRRPGVCISIKTTGRERCAETTASTTSLTGRGRMLGGMASESAGATKPHSSLALAGMPRSNRTVCATLRPTAEHYV